MGLSMSGRKKYINEGYMTNTSKTTNKQKCVTKSNDCNVFRTIQRPIVLGEKQLEMSEKSVFISWRQEMRHLIYDTSIQSRKSG